MVRTVGHGPFYSYHILKSITVEALVSEHPRDAKKVSVTGAGRLRERFSKEATRGVGDR